MRYLFVTLLSIGFLLDICYAGEKLELKDLKDKESYSLGYQFGEFLKKKGMEINLEIYTEAVRDGLSGKEPLMKPEEIRSAIQGIQQRTMTDQRSKFMELAAKNLSEGKAFLAENGGKEGVKTLGSGLQYKILKEGDGKKPTDSDTVVVNYRGTLINGTEFDSSKPGQPATLEVYKVIPGWREALKLMPVGSKWQLFVPPELAYGAWGAGRDIGPNATLIFEVELLAIK